MSNKDGSSFFYPTLLSEAAKWAQKNSLWPMPFGTSCCGIEMMSTLSSTYDLSRFGAEVVRFSPRQADMLIVAGTITTKMAPASDVHMPVMKGMPTIEPVPPVTESQLE